MGSLPIRDMVGWWLSESLHRGGGLGDVPLPCRDEKLLGEVVMAAFTMRRKTLRNALGRYPEEILRSTGVNLASRPETLSVADYVNITNALAEATT